ncbi:MAG: hypothetical protein ACT443_13465 [Gemmatimonadota bacterium]
MRLAWVWSAAVMVVACAEVEEGDQPGRSDSVAVVPVGPGTRPTAITPPDTPGSPAEEGARFHDSVATQTQRPKTPD